MMVTERRESGVVTYVLQPDRSLDWRGNLRFLGLISAISLSIAGWFAWLGMWLILPFAGLELTALGFALYLVSVRGLDKEIVSIKGDKLEISKGRWKIESTTCLQRCWIQVRLVPAEYAWYPKRLMIRSHGRDIEIGGFLGGAEKEHLAGELKRNI